LDAQGVAAAGDWAQAIKLGLDHRDQFAVIAASAAPECLGFATCCGGSASGDRQAGAAIEDRGRTSLGLCERDRDVG
jgi:hypothetical protein